MPLLLATHICWALDLRLRLPPDVKEKLTPGWWAVLDTMTVEGRRLLGEMMDSSGRAVFQGVVGEWTKWGRWKGN
jgi:nucleolar pre-ribosomal-associated protein 2